MKFLKFLEWLRAFSLAQKISMGVAATVVVGGCATTVAVAPVMNNNRVQVTSEASSEAVKETVVESKAEEVKEEVAIQFSPVKITASSIEKDLDIFFLDNDNQKIKGQNFSVKLVSVNDAKKLNSYVDAIAKINDEIKKVNETPSDKTKEKVSELNKKKVSAIGDYKDALKALNGTVYTDDNQDGRITQKKMAPGDFSLCYVPDNNYEASAYTQTTTIKDTVEYKPIEDIEERVVTEAEAGDVEPVHEVATEAVLEDTVEYIESTAIEQPGVYAQTTAAEIKASSSDPTSPADTDGVTVSKQVDLYPEISDGDSVVIGVAAGATDRISVESLSDRISASISGNRITISSLGDIPKEELTGQVSVKVTRILTGSSEVKSSVAASSTEPSSTEPSSTEPSSTEPSSSDPSSLETPSSTEPSTGSATPSPSEPSSSGSSSETQETPSVSNSGEKVVEVLVNVTVHGSNEQLKDAQGRVLFRDDTGANAATLEDYNANATFFYEEKAKGATKYTGWQTIGGAQYYFNAKNEKVTGTQVIRGVKYNFGNDGALLTSGIGIDVSKWQGAIDWSQAKTAISFAIIRAGFRGTAGGVAEDNYAVTNIKGCNANGIRCGLYVYSRATTKAEAIEEASLAISVLKKSGGTISLPIFIDMESDEQRAHPDVQDDVAVAFLNTVRNAGYSAGVYASKSWIESYLHPSKFGAFTMWVAQYNVTCNYSGHYDIWQYSSNGDIPGISTKVDMNEGKF
ncbi:MAG: hypothetical protein IK152_07145 [Lachnospiraceae bacterium]|nr:hypothetical protein [Lachnospiraceae bacterium]